MNFYTNVIRFGNNLLVREIRNGERIKKRVKYSPTLYSLVKSKTPYKTLDGEYVTPIKHETMSDATDWVKNYPVQSDLIYGNTQYAYSYISDTYKGDVNWDIDKLLVVTIDIEVECENGFPTVELAQEPMLSITIKNHQNKKIIVWGLNPFHNDRDDVEYRLCRDEKDLLTQFLNDWESYCPDIVTGWNTEFFDIPYLCNRIKYVLGEDELKRLSPWKSVQSGEIYKMGRRHQVYNIQGISHLDYFDLYRKFTYTAQESYRLDHIAKIELGESKAGNPFDTFREWYTKDYQSFIEYNIQDVEIVDRLEDKMKLIELCLTMAYDAKVNYTDVLGTVRYWDVLIYNYLKEKNIVIPQKTENEKSGMYEGAYVKDPIVGMHQWVVSFDLNSLYPHLIMQYNISPETLIPSDEEAPDKMVDKILNGEITNKTNYCMAPNGAFFGRTKEGSCLNLWKLYTMTGLNIKNFFLKLNRNMKIPKIRNISSTFHDMKISRWLKRFLSIVLMVLSVTTGFVILILEMLRPLLPVVNYLFVGLRKLSTFILTSYLKQRKKTMLSLQTRIQFTSRLTNLYERCLRIENIHKRVNVHGGLWTSLTVFVERKSNLLLISLIRILLRK